LEKVPEDRIDIEMPKSGERRRKRPKLVPVSEEMRRICEMLERELLRWPDVNVRPMFGMRAVYREKVVFAMLPDKRALENPKAIAYKRLELQGKDDEKWKLFELENEEHIGSALVHLERAYTKAAGLRRKESTLKRSPSESSGVPD
jgi:hypothetical protein